LLDGWLEDEKKMNCYFYGTVRNEKSIVGHNGVVAFSIPDLNLLFKAQIRGNQAEVEYASLIALLEFIELNPNLFGTKKINIFGDSPTVVHQVNFNLDCTKELEPYRNLALQYRRKFFFTLGWVSRNENRAFRVVRA
jgi:ribonuclease HI